MLPTALVELFVPPRCLCCGAPSGPMCGGCRRAVVALRDACPGCAQPRPCVRCPGAAAPWDLALAAVSFEGPGRQLVHALKYAQRLAAADVMAASLAVVCPPDGLLVPVPAHAGRVRRAGFDHAVELARALGRRTGLPVRPLLVREGAVLRQVDAGSGHGRRRAGRVRLAATGPAPAQVVLVDDVHTTGATLAAGATALRAAGAAQVTALTYARAVLGTPALDDLSKM